MGDTLTGLARAAQFGPFKMLRAAILQHRRHHLCEMPQRIVLHPGVFTALCADMGIDERLREHCGAPPPGASMLFMGVPIYEDLTAAEPYMRNARGEREYL